MTDDVEQLQAAFADAGIDVSVREELESLVASAAPVKPGFGVSSSFWRNPSPTPSDRCWPNASTVT
jgi:hypothetical protein